MLNIDAAKQIGFAACVDKLGRPFVLAHRDSAASAYGEIDGGVFCFVGVDDRPGHREHDGMLVLDDRSKFPYRVSCNVKLTDGIPDFVECVLPQT